jgi:ribonucleoside-diphosphate reductase alpha chain
MPITKVKKRDGRIVDFDETKIANAIWKAAKSVGGKDRDLAFSLAKKVVKELEKKYEDKIPTVEDIQDIVEKVLIEEGHAKTAKAYILYRQERRLIREEKKKILQKDTIDDVDKKFDLNAVRVLASRYLNRDEEGKICESIRELFERVAIHVGIVDVLYDKEFFDKNHSLSQQEIEDMLKEVNEFKNEFEEYDKKLSIGKYKLNKWHFEGFLRVYERLARRGLMKKRIGEVIRSIEEGKMDKYEKNIDEYYFLMVNKDFMPNSPTLMNAGNRLGQLSACFVLPIEDSLVSIMKTSSETALIHQSGGGVGINYSKLRHKGDVVASTHGVASGPVSFMSIIDTITEVVKQGGKRRGANMGILEVWHPDIEEFISIKQTPKRLENFNLSIGFWDDFFNALEENREYSLISPRTKKEIKKINPRQLFDLIAFSAWKCAEPGVLFFDNINKYNVLTNAKGFIRSTNPCGEQPLYEYESCNLGSINLKNFVKEEKDFDWERFKRVIRLATRFLDNIIDINKYPLNEIELNTLATRKIGLGVMGLGDLLYELEIPYNSKEGFEFMNKLAEILSYYSMDESCNIAAERGSFPLFEKSDYVKGRIPIAGYYELSKNLHNCDWDNLINKIKNYGIRNAFTTTIAPTGSISMICGCSNGIEPVFSLVFEKHVGIGKFYYVNEVFEKKLKELGIYNEELLEKIAKNYGCLEGLGVDESLKKVFVTALTIHWLDHIMAQAIWQRWISASISKTINMPNDAAIDDVKLSYLIARELGLKGVTIYRDGSRHQQVLYIPSEEKQKNFLLRPSDYSLNALKIKSEYTKALWKEYLRKLGVEVKDTKTDSHVGFPITNYIIQDFSNEEGRCPLCNGILIYEMGCNKCIECGWSNCLVS